MLRAPRRIGPLPKPLSSAELERIWRWERQMMAFYVTATTALVGAFALILLYPASAWAANAALVLLGATILGGAFVQFRERCPRCHSLLGRQARFVMPALCKTCGVEFPRRPAPTDGGDQTRA